MKVLARQGTKMTHEYFLDNEYLTMQGNQVIFEDGVKIFWSDWVGSKDWAQDGWSKYEG